MQLPKLYGGNYKLLAVLPAILALLSLFAVFVYPGIKFGIDLEGGSMILLRSDKVIGAEELKASLLAGYPLQELSVTTTSAPDGSHGAIIQFKSNTDFTGISSKIGLAESLADTDPARARNELASLSPMLAKYGVSEEINLTNAKDAVSQAKVLLGTAKENFAAKIESLVKEKFGITNVKSQRRDIGASLGKAFWDSAVTVAIFAVIAVIIVVFFFFREFVPSVAIILCGILDVLFAMASMAVLSIPLSLSSIPALLMLLGYSIDTDILLTTRLVNRKEGTARERAQGAMGTGLTMTGTTLAALIVMMIPSYFYQITVIFEITAVLFFGLLADVCFTWLMNAPIILSYVESKKGAGK